ncbi:unnamed protein product [Miscanthus lutarioriparius]|uniref:U2A'/phosphoprotein 32 family A C-terminal domain-containing protein n=1 Tax=Miscanthus lutarioriparius TaxID=422564 RepID=A0A811MGY6_9POAL|nr:unnamed protein product [Miscanthus lutarioriparius]
MAAVGEDDAAWERAISAATKATSAPKTLALDGIVKSSTGRLPSAALLERFAASLEELSVAGARLSSLEGLPRLPALRRLSLPDNRLLGAAALAAVAEACGATLRHLDLGNNRFADVQELAPLAGVGVESLDLYQCPVSKVKGYREKVFALIPSLKHLDGADAEGNERLETDDDEDDEEDDEEGGRGEKKGKGWRERRRAKRMMERKGMKKMVRTGKGTTTKKVMRRLKTKTVKLRMTKLMRMQKTRRTSKAKQDLPCQIRGKGIARMMPMETSKTHL